jgi:hypothetical protein
MGFARQNVWYGNPPKTPVGLREANDRYHRRCLPIRYAIENLRKDLAFARERVAELERLGQTGPALTIVKAQAAILADEMEQLTASLTARIQMV